MSDQATIKQRPYLIRAMHEWMTDNGLTPHIVADAQHEAVDFPPEHVTDGKIILNVSLTATRGLDLGNEHIFLETRFGGVPRELLIPVGAVLGIYARETGQGMVFAEEEPEPAGPPPSEAGKPNLKVVK